MNRWHEVSTELNTMVNEWYETPEIRRLLSVRLTPARIAFRKLHITYFGNNRRDCWAAVSSKAPLDVKRAIWEHEKDELIYDERMGKAHVTEKDLDESDESKLVPGARAAFYAWFHCAREKPWLEGLACSHILERRNNDRIVRGGTLTQRLVKRQMEELGIEEKDLDVGTRVHMFADVEHSALLDSVFERYVVDDRSAKEVLNGAQESLIIERAFHGSVATAMEELD
ncbi:MAG TPA: hypothetical protein VIH18_03290 [Candidatus Binatia bacterium]|jgi:hypothetical protein